ncbi:MAG: rhodanese domain-containing protein, partial [Candidatus Kerfeldbacteria bacterium]|nr:rhodanese domain-containing protein [Candidatus Kerfeldbacteria bacterium]
SLEQFRDIEFKEHAYHENPFVKLKIKYRRELVTLGVNEITAADAAQHLSPQDWHALAQQPDTVVLDVRNEYESRIGKFKHAITPDIANFRELPAWLQQHQELKDKKVLVYCTGGIRCEKASAVLKKSGVGAVYQLHGGIINYGKEIPNGLWQGSCFVFDQRMAVPVNDPAHHQIISQCHYCSTATDTYYNCANVDCNALMLLCPSCLQTSQRLCSGEKQTVPALPNQTGRLVADVG